MKNILSYTLFGDHPRYWTSIPFLMIANEMIHEYAISRIHLPPSAQQHLCYPLLKLLSERGKRLEIKVVDRRFVGTEPTIWRIMPLWDTDVQYLFCRDIDAVPSSDERRAVQVFMDSNYFIHGIRSWWTHSTTLMAGLCGFNAARLRTQLQRERFETYRDFGFRVVKHCKRWEWGCDQHLLHRYFLTGRRGQQFKPGFLDSPIGSAPELKTVYRFTPNQVDKSKYDDVSLNGINAEILAMCDGMVRFLGEPVTVKPNYLNDALKLDSEAGALLKEIFQEHERIREYYEVTL